MSSHVLLILTNRQQFLLFRMIDEGHFDTCLFRSVVDFQSKFSIRPPLSVSCLLTVSELLQNKKKTVLTYVYIKARKS